MQTMLDVGFLDVGLALPSNDEGPDSGSELLALLVDELAHGVLLISAQGWILHANQVARRELERGVVLNTRRGELEVASPAGGKAFQHALAKALSGKRSLIKLCAKDAGFMLAVIPLNHRAGAPCEHIALFLSRVGVSELGVFGAFARSHGLTRTEEQVLVFLCRSLGTPEIAIQMKVAVSTVRSHVRSLCNKTASRGVRELVNRVAILPPIAPLSLGQLHQ